MAKPGTKPLPSNMRLVGGNAGHRAPAKNEPKPPIRIPSMPESLSKAAQPYFQQYAKHLAAMRVLSDVDVQALCLLSESTATYWECMEKVRRTGIIVKIGDKGYTGRNPYLTEANKAMQQMSSMLTEFGLTPSSRTRVRQE